MAVETLRPDVGTEVEAYFGANCYRAVVVRYGRVYPYIRFVLKNGRVVEGRATILPYGVSTGVTYVGYLAQMYA